MANISDAKPSPKSGTFDKLPKLSTSVWLLVIGGLFLIAMVPLTMNLINASSQQYVLITRLAQLQTQYEDLKSRLSSQAQLTTEINTNKQELQSLKTFYKKVDQNPEISQEIVSLTWDYDVTIISMGVTRAAGKVGNYEFPTLSYTLNLSGQVANIQNLIIAMGTKFPTCQILNVNIAPAQIEGELDKATILIQIYCYRDT